MFLYIIMKDMSFNIIKTKQNISKTYYIYITEYLNSFRRHRNIRKHIYSA